MKFKDVEIAPKLHVITRYKIRNALTIAAVPLFSAITVITILFIFIKLNLYYLESNGMMIDAAIRGAYYDQMIQHMIPLLGFFALLIVGSGFVGYVVVGWATSPFTDAKKLLDEIMFAEKTNVKKAVYKSRYWLTESPEFTQIIQEFIERMLTGKVANRGKSSFRSLPTNFRFIIKFALVFTALSIISGYTLGLFIGSVYEKVLSLGVHFLNVTGTNITTIKGHYFTAQQEILDTVILFVMAISILVYILIARKIETYMENMIFVFSRSLREGRFPVRLRQADLYHDLADTINRAYHKFRDRAQTQTSSEEKPHKFLT